MNVIVEQDSLSAWIGLVGVVVGILLSGGLDLWRVHVAERKERRRDTHRAADELVAAANSLLVATGAYGTSQARGESLLEWTQLMMTQAERMQRASADLIRFGSPDLAKAAEDLSTAAVNASADFGKAEIPQSFTTALHNFTSAIKKI